MLGPHNPDYLSLSLTGRPRNFLAALMRSIRRWQSSRPCSPLPSGDPAFEAKLSMRASEMCRGNGEANFPSNNYLQTSATSLLHDEFVVKGVK